MSKGNIMLCLLRLDIGGIETHVLNQTKELISRGYNVVILAKYGIYKDVFQKTGAICIDYEFKLSKKYELEKAKQIADIIKKYQIDQVHIHQLDCATYMLPACISTNTHYIAYAHTGITGIYDWWERMTGYNIMFRIYFKLADKIVTITDRAKEENKAKYEIDDEKYIVIKNSINFQELEQNVPTKKIEKFLLVSRLDEEKKTSLKNSIDIFKSYLKENKNAYLTIVGDGNIRDFVEQEIQDFQENCKMLGARNDVIDIIKQNDVVMGLDRCMLEALASKRIAIVSGYEGNKNIILPENVEEAAKLNFSGENLENKEISEIIDILKNLNEEEITKIENENYKYVYENLNIKNNIFVLDTNLPKKEFYCNIDNKFLEEINKIIQNVYDEIKLKDEIFNVKVANDNRFEKTIKYLEEKVKYLENDNTEKTELLNRIYNSRSWKYTEKLRKIIKKFKGKEN